MSEKRELFSSCDLTEMLGYGAAIMKLETNETTYFIEQVPPGISPEVYSKSLLSIEGLNVWSLVCNIRFIEVPTPESAIIIVSMRPMPKQKLGSMPLATANYPNGEGQLQHLHLNSLRKWTGSNSIYAGVANVRVPIRHEAGHLIGLVHPPEGPPIEIMDERISSSIKYPARTEAAIARKLYGPPKASIRRFFMYSRSLLGG